MGHFDQAIMESNSDILTAGSNEPVSGKHGRAALREIHPAPAASSPALIKRFQRSEILLHWSIAIPFMVCFATGLILKLFYNLHSEGHSRDMLSWIHRIAGVFMMALPIITLLICQREYRLYLANIKEAWTWVSNDWKWLLLFGPSAVNPRIVLPEQGKFNAAEKLNFMMVVTTYPVFILTGLLVWMPGAKFLSWIVHVFVAVAATPLMLGHIYMAVFNPDTRPGLRGMSSGYVDGEWARHHYGRWYRQHFENPGQSVKSVRRGRAGIQGKVLSLEI